MIPPTPKEEARVELVESADGTRIAFDRSGSGPAVVLVLGASCDRSTSKPLAGLLASSYTVYEYDRRGRGDSGDGLPLSIDGEVQDLAAVAAGRRRGSVRLWPLVRWRAGARGGGARSRDATSGRL